MSSLEQQCAKHLALCVKYRTFNSKRKKRIWDGCMVNLKGPAGICVFLLHATSKSLIQRLWHPEQRLLLTSSPGIPVSH
ncbi:hypothetical protein EW026_g8181 [Hermanssonia centrifuga]|uniref:Uncharacterized protein n=1 Tax=Hermanssonia centrifuga TaxID=98765 RepID=A0A4S4K579_9APHY|nr:hypothetical protein EW026_g8181 [Hermanssonia centrifuga]